MRENKMRDREMEAKNSAQLAASALYLSSPHNNFITIS